MRAKRTYFKISKILKSPNGVRLFSNS